MTTEENKQLIRRFVEEAINQQNAGAIDEIVAQDFVEHVPFPGQGPGREGLKYAVAALLSGFPDMQWTIDEQVAEGEKVVSRFTMRGTHHGEFLAIPPTGKSIEVWGIVIDVVRNREFAESRIILDMMGLMHQLGVAG